MKNSILTLFVSFLALTAAAQKPVKKTAEPVLIKNQTVEAACGECKFGLKGKSCDLAVRIDGKAYFVDGAKIDDFGDAHEKDGFCKAIRKAEVSGTIENGRFKSTSFNLLPEEKKKD